MADRDNFGAFIVGFLVGGLTGAIIALLYAPQSGEETRTVIKEKAIELKDKTAEGLEDAYDKAEVAATEALEKAKALAKTAKDKTKDLTARGAVVLEEQKAKIKKVAGKAEEPPAA